MTGRWIMAAVAALAAAAPAQAEWLKATTRHFVVYSDTKPDTLRRDASELERFDSVIRRVFPTDTDAQAEFNRVTVYVVPSSGRVGKMAGDANVAGFYVPRVTGSVAFTPRLGDTGTNALSPRIVLFHEYAHHFLLGNWSVAYPAWFSEGFAEFASTVKEMKGAYMLGGAANHRAYGLLEGKGLAIRQLLAPPARMTDRQREAIYGRGWLLTHYLMFDAGRRKQLGRYLDLLNAGKPSVAAATEAFGDLDTLDRELDRYLGRRTLPAFTIDATQLATPTVDIRSLTAGEAALIGYRMDSTRGVDAKTAPPLYARAAAAAERVPRDPISQGWLAEMAYDAGKLDAAEAAADAAITADPTSSQALLYKARVRLARAVTAKSADSQVWREARSWIVRANRARNDDTAALALFYESFLQQDATPSKSAVDGLYRAVELVPQDAGMRFLAARQMILDDRLPAARNLLRVLAADPHAGPENGATRLLALLDSGQKGQAALDALETPGKTDAGKGD